MSVSRTAVMTAALRAAETARPDRLFDDPLASAFVAAVRAAGEPVVQLPPGASEFAAIRTRFFDDAALAACAGGVRQVVLLAAGFDSRAFRLAWPNGVRATADAIRATAGAQLVSTVDDPVRWLAGHAWRATVSRIPALGVHYGRPLPEYVDPAASDAVALVSATR